MTIKRLFLGFLLLSSLFSLYAASSYHSRYEAGQTLLNERARDTAVAEVASGAARLEAWLSSLTNVVQGIAADVNAGRLAPHEFQSRLSAELARTPDAAGIGILFYPLATDPDFRKKTPFYLSRDASGTERATPAANEYGQISAPLCSGTGSESRLMTGFVVLDLPRKALKERLSQIRFEHQGYTSLIGPDGSFVWHPREEMLNQRKSLFDLAMEGNIPSLMTFGREAIHGRRACRETIGPLTGVESWAICHPVPTAGWSLVAIIDRHDLLRPAPAARQLLMHAILSGIYGLSALVLFASFLPSLPSFNRLWIGSCFVSVILCAGIALVWNLAMEYGEEPIVGSTSLIEPSVVARFQEDFTRDSTRLGWEKPLFIPTGVYIQSIAFDGALSVKVSGYIWQVFTPETASLTPGVIFPEAIDDVSMNKAYERQDGENLIIGWNFSASLRQWFNYQRYPFDQQSVWLQIWPMDFDKNVILTPDLASYELLNPQTRPGIRSDIVLPGWNISKSYFSYIHKDYNTTFGFRKYQGGKYFPELFFHVIIKRKFLDPFLSNLLPLLVVAFLNFGAILIATRREKLQGLFGFSAGTSMGIAGGLVFVVILAQNDLRQRLEIERLMYLDFYYFVMYLLLITVAIDAVLFTWSKRSWFLHGRDHLYPKLLYWPVTMALLFAVTVWSFYP